MITNILKQLRTNSLTDKKIIEVMFTYFGGSVYGYMLLLTNQKRLLEAELIKSFRDAIFAMRNEFQKSNKLTDIHVTVLHEMQARIGVQIAMIRSNPTISWEAEFLTTMHNEFIDFYYICNCIVEEQKLIPDLTE